MMRVSSILFDRTHQNTIEHISDILEVPGNGVIARKSGKYTKYFLVFDSLIPCAKSTVFTVLFLYSLSYFVSYDCCSVHLFDFLRQCVSAYPLRTLSFPRLPTRNASACCVLTNYFPDKQQDQKINCTHYNPRNTTP